MRFSTLLFSILISSIGFTQQIVRGPYLQIGTSQSIIIRWRTDVATNSKVMFGTSPNQLNRSANDGSITTEHEVKLADLTPNTTYYYNVGSFESVQGSGADYYFRTSVPAGSQQKVRIWAMGDMGNGSANQKAVRDAYLKNVGQDNRQTDAVLLLGDNAYSTGTDQEYQWNFFPIYQEHFLRNNVLWPVPGNHEYYSGIQNSRDIDYFKIFNLPKNAEAGGMASGTEMYYSFDIGLVHIVALDSYGIEQDRFRLSDTLGPQVEWLKKDLAANRLPWTIVMFHHPPYTKNNHDSDAEQELVLLRQNLTPILERFQVDLVLSGHSHLYERSRPMRGHRGLAGSFVPQQFNASSSSGRYDGSDNSCAYLAKRGTIYAVVGSSGQLSSANGPVHPAMPFANGVIGGSAVIEVENNRLDFRWLASDGVVRDAFTIFNEVNKTTRLEVTHGDVVKLNASWKGTYRWNDANRDAERSIQILNDQTITVQDQEGCLQDKFEIRLKAKPSLQTNAPTGTVCAGQKISFPFTVSQTKPTLWRYEAQLSDHTGNFTNPAATATVSDGVASLTLPENLPASDGYKVRVLANTEGFEYNSSAAFSVRQKASATLSGDATIDAGEKATLTLNFAGSPPFTYKLSNTTSETTTEKQINVSVSPMVTTNYALQAISNVCGEGTISGTSRVTVIPRLESSMPKNLTICNGSELTLSLNQTGQFATPVNYLVQLSDAKGDFAKAQTLTSGTLNPFKVTIPSEVSFGTEYRLRVLPDGNALAKVSPTEPFTIYQKASGVMSGDTLIKFGDKATLTLRFGGTAPWTYTLSDNTNGMSEVSPLLLSVSPTAVSSTYSLQSVSNRCGSGTASGSAKVNLIITAITPQITDEIVVFPNPTSDSFLLKSTTIAAYQWQLVNAEGKVIKMDSWQSSIPVEVHLRDLPAGIYWLHLTDSVGQKAWKIIKH